MFWVLDFGFQVLAYLKWEKLVGRRVLTIDYWLLQIDDLRKLFRTIASITDCGSSRISVKVFVILSYCGSGLISATVVRQAEKSQAVTYHGRGSNSQYSIENSQLYKVYA